MASSPPDPSSTNEVKGIEIILPKSNEIIQELKSRKFESPNDVNPISLHNVKCNYLCFLFHTKSKFVS